MKKERLVSLKQIINQDFTERHDVPQLHFNQSDLRWLIEQAERAEELEEKNERLREVLKSIASQQEIGEGYEYADQVANDLIWTAKSALEVSK